MSGAEPQITTVIPTYRRPQLLKRAVWSVLNQTYSNLLVCVYDNASGDETADVVHDLARRDQRVHYHCHPENIGWLKSFAYGMSRVDTPYLHLLSDDDVILPHFFEQAMHAVTQHAGLTAFAGVTVRLGPRFMDPVETGRTSHSPKLPHGSRHTFDAKTGLTNGLYRPPDGLVAMLVRGRPEWTGMVFSTKALSTFRGLDESLAEACDAEFVYRAGGTGTVFLTRTLCAAFTLHEGSVSHSMWSSSRTGSLRLAVMSKLESEYGEHEAVRNALALARAWIGRRLFAEALSAIELGRAAQAIDAANLVEREFGWEKTARLLRFAASIRQSKFGELFWLGERLIRRSRQEIRFAFSRYQLRHSWPEIQKALAIPE